MEDIYYRNETSDKSYMGETCKKKNVIFSKRLIWEKPATRKSTGWINRHMSNRKLKDLSSNFEK